MNAPREDQLLQLALTKPASERIAFLDRACGNDPALRGRLEALLAAHEQPDTLLATQPEAARPPIKRDLPDAQDEAVGQTLGRYKLLEKIGEGGCGVVYVAEQTEPVRRRVALKVIKLGMDTKQVVARFEAERQALAMMDHPNIAKVLDAGTVDFAESQISNLNSEIQRGRPYFVMELVRGIPITHYCDQEKVTTKERLDLFIKVCQAIQHAHQKGIIHRDIKPSNILVTLHDGVLVPKVIDFGIAKATEGRLTDNTVYTQLHQFIGTPAYMSPEQVEMSGLDIDTRSDIYSLGVLLYELLTGKTPFDAQELMSLGIDAMRKTIREEEPARPSKKLATLQGDELTTTAKRRSVETSKLANLLRGDLDWIVMKCLEKDRARRYETANGLAADLKRHLSHEPVVARPPSTAYRLQKAFRRNKLVFASGAAIAVAVLMALGFSSWSLLRERKARIGEQTQRQEAETQRKVAQAAQSEATNQRDLAQDRLLNSLIREMRSISTIRPLGYLNDLQDRVRQALELPKAVQRRDEIRAEFTQGLGDPLGAEPVEIVWDPPLDPSDLVRVALNSDGELAAVWRNGHSLVIRKTRTGRSVAAFENLGLPLWGLDEFRFNPVFSVDGHALYGIIRVTEGTGPDSFSVSEWRRNSDGSWAPRQRPPQPVFAVFGTREGVFAVEPAAGEMFQVLNLETGRSLGAFSPPLNEVRRSLAAALAPKRGLIALGTSTGVGRLSTVVKVWGLSDPQRHVRLESVPGMGRIHSARFSQDEKYLACTCENGAVIYETTEFKIVSRLFGYVAEAFSGGAFVGDGTTFAIPQGQRPGIRLLSLTSGAETHLKTPEVVGDLVASEDGSTLAFQTGQKICFVRLADSRERRRLSGHVGGVTALEFSPDGRLIASTGKDGSVRLWDAATGTLRQSVARTNAIGQSLGFSPDSRWLAIGDYQHDQIQILNVESGQEVLTLGKARPGYPTYGCGFSPDGRWLAAVGAGGLRVWDLVPAAENVNRFPWETRLVMDEEGKFRNLLFDPAGRWIAFAGRARADRNFIQQIFVRSLDPKGMSVSAPAETSWVVQSMGLLPGRNELAYTALNENAQRVQLEGERTLHFLNLATREIVRSMPLLAQGERSATYISNLRFSPDGSRLAAANHEGRRVNLYDVASGRRLYSLPDETGVIWWLAWHPDGRRLAVTRENGDISIWNLPEVEAAIAEVGLAP
jgi:YD repeat-containing protein